jgi:hypothetical protein
MNVHHSHDQCGNNKAMATGSVQLARRRHKDTKMEQQKTLVIEWVIEVAY